eukprot:CAMPEP_0204156628 /NCGR_PEP_ID=MMETSP0361-20130328/30583_1 /ASSEMBLY_ACC=CAM_ASM_000343 /TAXON_ID=268821 /ORGANISM="Scrippsiella Hangoei, Strain SHTV-5" /LENGTH=151 /DNA_ID=CAMNT_0051112285 /DNA_START=135 /DNA_END=591 /DNA_ORIENTATION=+
MPNSPTATAHLVNPNRHGSSKSRRSLGMRAQHNSAAVKRLGRLQLGEVALEELDRAALGPAVDDQAAEVQGTLTKGQNMPSKNGQCEPELESSIIPQGERSKSSTKVGEPSCRGEGAKAFATTVIGSSSALTIKVGVVIKGAKRTGFSAAK